VSVHASTVNPIDCRVRHGYGHRVFAKKRGVEFLYIPGSELSAIVVKVGVKVKGLVTGDAVIAGGSCRAQPAGVPVIIRSPASSR
jgi:NADPH:quinone reductase-like Zn-dependent oxidoreductase